MLIDGDTLELRMQENVSEKSLKVANAYAQAISASNKLIDVSKLLSEKGAVLGYRFTYLDSNLKKLNFTLERNFAANKKTAAQWDILGATVNDNARRIEVAQARIDRALERSRARDRRDTLQQIVASGQGFGARELTPAIEAKAWQDNTRFINQAKKARDAYYTNLGKQYMQYDPEFNKKLQEGTKRTKEFTLSWRTMVRLVEAQIMYQAFYAFLNQMQQAITTAGELSRKIGLIRTISQEAQLSTEEWARGIVKISNMFGTDVLDTAGATYEAISNQVAKGQEAIRFMEIVGKLSMTTGSTQMEAMEALSGVMNAYGQTVDDAEKISAQFFKTVDLGRVQLGQIANSIGQVVGPASLLGVKFEEVASALSLLTIRGISPAMALTQLRQIMFALIKPSKEMKEQLAAFGVESGQALIQTYGFATAMGMLESAAKDDASELGELFKNIRALVPALIFAGKGMDEYNSILKETKDSTKTYNDASTLMFNNVGTQSQIATTRIKNSLLKLGEGGQELYVKIANALGIINISGERLAFTLQNKVEQLKKAANDEKQLLLESVQSEEQIYLRHQAELFRLLNTRIKNSKDAYETYAEDFKDINDHVLEGIKEQFNTIKNGISEAGRTIKSTKDFIGDLFTKQESIRFEWEFDKADTNGKIALFRKQIAHLLEADKTAVALGDLDTLKDNGREIFRIYQEIYRLQQDSDKKNIGSSRKKTEMEEDYARRLQQAERNLEAAQNAKKPNQNRIKTLQENIKAIESDRDAKLASLNTVLNETGNAELRRLNLDKEIEASIKRQTEMAKKLITVKQDEEKKLSAQKITQELLLDDIRDTIKESNKFKIDKVLELESEEAIQKAMEKRKAITDKLIQFQNKAGVDLKDQITSSKFTGAEQEQVENKLTQLRIANEKKVYDARIKYLEDVISKAVERKNAIPLLQTEIQADAATAGNLESSYGNYATERKQLRQVLQSLTHGQLDRAAMMDAIPKLRAGVNYIESRTDERTAAGKMAAEQNIVYTDAITKVIDKLTKALQIGDYKDEQKYQQLIMDAQERLKRNNAELEAINKEITAKDKVTESTEKVTGSLNQLVNAMSSVDITVQRMRAFLTTAEPKATGGQIGTDTVSAMLTPGEFVMNAASSRRFYTQLLSMNNNGVRHFASGGPVTNTGDFNISVQSSGNSTVDAVKIGKALRRAIRQGRITL